MDVVSVEVYPRCKTDDSQVYVSAEGHVVPCCWLGNEPTLEVYRSFHGENIELLNVNHRPLGDILADPLYSKIESTWGTSEPFWPCKMYCGRPFETKGQRESLGMDQALYLNLKVRK